MEDEDIENEDCEIILFFIASDGLYCSGIEIGIFNVIFLKNDKFS